MRNGVGTGNGSPGETIKNVLNRLGDSVKPAGAGKWSARCPAHDDRRASLSITTGDDGRALLYCHAGCTFEAITSALNLRPCETFQPKEHNGNGHAGKSDPRPSGKPQRYKSADEAIAAARMSIKGATLAHVWIYRNRDGDEVMHVARFNTADGKEFRPVHRKGVGWKIGDPPGSLPLYMLDALPTEGPIFICEGEKATDAAAALGLAVTTSAHGASAADKSEWTPLAGRNVVILPDNDDPGMKYGRDVSKILLKLTPPARVKIVNLPGLPDGGDVVEYVGIRDSQDDDAIRASILALADTAPIIDASSIIGGPVVTCAADVVVEKISWIWRGRLARKKAVLWVGAPGDGKGTVAADIASRLSTGSPMPDGDPGAIGDVLFIASEDGISDIWVPRLKAAGADLKRIHHVAMIRRIDEDGKAHEYLLTVDNVTAIESVLVTLNEPIALFVDPIGNHIGDRTDTDKDNKIRAALVPLCALAERYNLALILIGHRRKAGGRSADETMMGSTGFVGLARAIFHFGRDKQNRDLRYFCHGKTNIGIDAANLSFHIEDYEGVGRVVWDKSPALMTADELLTQDSQPGPEPECREAGESFLRQLLADGPVPSGDVQKQAKAAGIAWRTVRRAGDALKVRREKCKFTGGWQWRLPKAGNQLVQVPRQDGQQKPCVGNLANMDTFGPLPQGVHIKSALAREGVHVVQDSCTDSDPSECVPLVELPENGSKVH